MTADERIAELERRLALAEARIAQLEQTTWNIRPMQPVPSYPMAPSPSTGTPPPWHPYQIFGTAAAKEPEA